MSRYRISNQIFALGLDAQEMSIYAYLCSLPSERYTLDGAATVCVKQSTIAQKCGIRAAQTVSKVIGRLCERGLVEPLGRLVKADRRKGTYRYAVRHLPLHKGWFWLDRHVFGRLTPRQMLIYLFLCKSFRSDMNICWNSYQDIARQTGMKREMVIQTVNELVHLHLIVRIHKRARENNKVYVDNRYQIVIFQRGRIHKGKKIVRLLCENSHTTGSCRSTEQLYHSTLSRKCQGSLPHFFETRGSPSDQSHNEYPHALRTERKKLGILQV